jgi:hypothetical protein
MLEATIRERSLPAAHDSTGPIAWTRRDASHCALAERIDRHAARACTAVGKPARNAVLGATIWKRHHDLG